MEVRFKATEKQALALDYLTDDKTTEIGFWGWAWGGKSLLGVFRLWMMALTYPNTRRFIGRKELINLRKTTLNTYYKFCQLYNIPKQDQGTLDWQTNTIKFPNWSEILLLDLARQPSDPLYTRFWSLELTGWFIDESNEIDEQAIIILSTRVWRQNNQKHGIKQKILETFNPDKWHVYKRFYKASRDGTLPEYRTFIPSLATDNKYIDASYLEQLARADEVTKQRLLYGNFDYDQTPGRLFIYDDLLNMRNNPIHNWDKYISIDWACEWRDLAVLTVWDWYEIKEIVVWEKSSTIDISSRAKELAGRYGVPLRNIVNDHNWVWAGISYEIGEVYKFTSWSSPITSDGEPKPYRSLRDQCLFKLWDNIHKIRFPDTKYKERIIEELDCIVQVDIDKDWPIRCISKDEIKKKIWHSPDFLDNLTMRMVFELKKKKLVGIWTF